MASTEGADNLDGLLDDLITGDIAADSTKELPTEDDTDADATPTAISTEGADNLDGLLDDLITDDVVADSTKKHL